MPVIPGTRNSEERKERGRELLRKVNELVDDHQEETGITDYDVAGAMMALAASYALRFSRPERDRVFNELIEVLRITEKQFSGQ